MIREIIKPEDDELIIKIPQDYIGQEIEYIIFPVNEKESKKADSQKAKKSLRGVFSQYAENAKIPLEKSAWQNHVMEKFQSND